MDRDEKPKPNVDATIQLDQIDADQIALESQRDIGIAKRVTPPPLPPEEIARASKAPAPATTVSHAPSAPPPKPRSMGMTVALVGAFVVLVIVAIVGGLHVGGLARGTAPSASASVSVAAAPTPRPTPSPTPSASASGHVEITIPTIEMR